jgi:hypothetical protein
LACSSVPESRKCYTTEERTVVFEQLVSSTTKLQNIVFSIFGITNPGSTGGQTSELSVYIVSSLNRQVYAAGEKSFRFTIQTPPLMLNMTYVNVDDLRTSSQAVYSFGFNTIASTLPIAGAIWIDWPNEYIDLFVRSDYSCSYDNTVLKGSPSCDFKLNTGRKRTEITGHTNALTAPSEEVRLIIRDLPTLQQSGTSPQYSIATYDATNKVILERSYPSSSIIDTLDFINGQAQVSVRDVVKISVYRGTYSKYINIELDRAASN